MTTTTIRETKNAPLALPSDRETFVQWAVSEPDGSVSAGHQPLHPCLSCESPEDVLKLSAARLVSLARRERGQTAEQFAVVARVRVSDVLALEHGEQVSAETVRRIAQALQLSCDALVQLMGLSRVVDQTLVRAATEFVGKLDAAEPLGPREVDALHGFKKTVAVQGAHAE